MTKAFLIAGFRTGQTAEHKRYKQLRRAIATKGYEVVPIPIMWNHTTVAEFCDKFVDFYNKNKGQNNIVIGNSYGAMVAFLTAPEVKPNKVFACSLSPYFKEDLNKTTEAYRIKWFGKKRAAAQKYLSAKETARKINELNIPVVLLYGEKEKKLYPFLVARVKESARDLKNSKLVEIPKAAHSFYDEAYVNGLVKELSGD